MIPEDMRMFTYRGLWFVQEVLPGEPLRVTLSGHARAFSNKRSRAATRRVTSALIISPRTCSPQQKKAMIDAWWRNGDVETDRAFSADHIPWELHGICDPVARKAAYSAWNKEMRP